MLTQARAFGAFTGRRYGAFSGKSTARNVGELTQARAFGAMTGRRYGSFAAKQATAPEVTPAESSGGIWRQREHLRRFIAEQHALDEARKAKQAAEAAFEALEREKAAETARSDALKVVRETSAAFRRLQAEVAAAKRRLDAAQQAESARGARAAHPDVAPPLQTALQAALAPLVAQIEVVEAPEARRGLGNRRRAAILAALLLLD